MASRGCYAVTSREEAGGARHAELDQSYRSCLLSLLIFFLLCVVLVLASFRWNKSHDGYRNENVKGPSITAITRGEALTTSEQPDSEIQLVTEKNVPPMINGNSSAASSVLPVNGGEPFERYVHNASGESSEVTFKGEESSEDGTDRLSTESYVFPGSVTSQQTPEEYSNDGSVGYTETTTATSIDSTTASTTDPIMFNIESSSSENIEEVSKSHSNKNQLIFTKIPTWEIGTTTSESPEKSSTGNDYSTSSIGSVEDSGDRVPITKRPADPNYTSLRILLVSKYFGNESATPRNEAGEANWLDEISEYGTTAPSKQSYHVNPESVKDLTSTSKSRAEEELPVNATTRNYTFESTSTSAENIERETNVCTTGRCKQMASKMLSYMNHSADPCDDFYEYACGGFEADHQITETDLSMRVYDTIERQSKKYKNHSEYGQFYDYYESCLNYEAKFTIEHRIDLAREALEKIGKFYTTSNWPQQFQGFTRLFANMLQQDRPLLFDIVPDINETNPEAFTLKIGPTVDSKLFRFANEPDSCDNENEQSQQAYVNLDQLYRNYKNCKNDTRSFVTSIKQALTELGIFDSLKNVYNISQYIDRTVIDIDLEIIEKILWNYPSESEIHDAYRSKRYTVMTLGTLEDYCKLLNWTELIESLTGLTLDRNALLQIYDKDRLIEAMRHLDDFGRNQPLDLNNALLGLYARNLFQDFVVTRSSKDCYKHCLYMATHLMEKEASALYMSTLTDSNIRNMKTVMGKLFRELKETLGLEIQKSEWTEGWGREVLLKKLNDIKMSLPDPSLVKKKSQYEVNITDNYFVNSMNLMKKSRSTIYSVIDKNPRHLEQIWTFFASPLERMPRTIYALNVIVMPFGAIDWPTVSGTRQSFDYLTQATIGYPIAREIAHNFDTNGIRYWNGSRDSEFALLSNDDPTKIVYDEYTNCHRNSLYQDPIEMSLPITGQRVSFTIGTMSLNERLSDAAGMILAKDTLARLGTPATTKQLPWLKLDVGQLFYLAYTQTHCTKAPLTSSYVSLHEDPLLPSRIRVFVVASNDKFFGEAWKCPEGSNISPPFVCNAFPHLDSRADGLDAV